MRLKYLDLIVIMIIALLNVIWALLSIHSPVIGTILALPLVFVLPGYVVTEVLLRKRSLDAFYRLAFSLGLSLSIAILGGLILNILPWGLQSISWALFLGSLTVAFSLLAAYLRRGKPIYKVQLPRQHFTIFGSALFGLATIVIILAVLYSANGAAQQRYPGFTQVWMLPVTENGGSCAARLGVHSFESTSVTYRIVVTMNGAEVSTWTSVTLEPQGEWDRLVPIIPKAVGDAYVEALLYRLDKPETVYREVHFTFHNCRTLQVTH